jgi:hypothetical protein
VGHVSESVDVTASNQLDQVDTTNGYVLGETIIQNTPLGTGSFTQLAILSPGVNADLLGGSGTNAGLGNQAIWANGQRDTSNSFTLNAISERTECVYKRIPSRPFRSGAGSVSSLGLSWESL